MGRLLLLTGAAIDGALPQTVKYRIASLLAGMVFALWRTGRENVTANMSHVLGKPVVHPETQRLAKMSMENYGWYMADFLSWMRMTPERLQKRVRELHGRNMSLKPSKPGRASYSSPGTSVFGTWAVRCLRSDSQC